MGQKFKLSLLILCVVLSSKTATSSKDNNIEDLHARKKRIIDKTWNRSRRVTIQEVPYIVNILENGQRCCAGSILSPLIIITAAHCVLENANYSILSGSALKDNGTLHNVLIKIIHKSFSYAMISSDLALLKISPPIDLVHSPNRKIKLQNGYVRPNSIGIFSGWGCTNISRTSRTYPDELRSTALPIISLLACQNHYRDYVPITSKSICTYTLNRRKGSCDGDSGSPLVVDRHLVGVMSWCRGYLQYPDVFVNVAYPMHRIWIISNMREM